MKWSGFYPFVMQWLTNAAVLLLVPIFSVVYTLTHYKFELAGKIDAPSSESLRWYEVVIRGLLENLLTYADWSAEKLQRETGLVEDAFADKLKVTSVSLVVTIFISLASLGLRELLYFLKHFERSATARPTHRCASSRSARSCTSRSTSISSSSTQSSASSISKRSRPRATRTMPRPPWSELFP